MVVASYLLAYIYLLHPNTRTYVQLSQDDKSNFTRIDIVVAVGTAVVEEEPVVVVAWQR